MEPPCLLARQGQILGVLISKPCLSAQCALEPFPSGQITQAPAIPQHLPADSKPTRAGKSRLPRACLIPRFAGHLLGDLLGPLSWRWSYLLASKIDKEIKYLWKPTISWDLPQTVSQSYQWFLCLLLWKAGFGEEVWNSLFQRKNIKETKTCHSSEWPGKAKNKDSERKVDEFYLWIWGFSKHRMETPFWNGVSEAIINALLSPIYLWFWYLFHKIMIPGSAPVYVKSTAVSPARLLTCWYVGTSPPPCPLGP